MPLFGSHLSIAGGYEKAVIKAGELGFDCVQIFTKNNNQWRAKPIEPAEVERFQSALADHHIVQPISHDSYLINLASPDDELWTKSIDAMVIELERAHRLGIEHVVAHPGAHMGTGEEAGLARIARAIEIVLGRTADLPTSICLETTAGQGSTLGYRFEHLGWLMSRLDAGPRLTACVDSCHVVAAGYALSPRKDYLATMEAFGEAVGFERLVALHINDSKKPLGSRVDRHEHIGRGCLGLEPFEHLVNDPRLAKLPMYLETAKEDEPTSGRPWDAINLETLRSLMSSQAAKKSTSTKRVKGSAGRK